MIDIKVGDLVKFDPSMPNNHDKADVTSTFGDFKFNKVFRVLAVSKLSDYDCFIKINLPEHLTTYQKNYSYHIARFKKHNPKIVILP